MQAIQKAKNNFHQKWFRHALFRRQQEDNKIATTSRFLTKINADYKTKTPSKRGLSNLTINFDTGDRGRTDTSSTDTGFWVQRVCQFRHTGITTKYILPSLAAFVKRPKAVTGIEPVMKVLQTSALPLGYTAINFSRDTKYLNWGNWIRTSAWRYQKPLPYRLAIPQ